MTKQRLFHAAEWGDAIHDVQNAAGNPIFKEATLEWCQPRTWPKGENAPVAKGMSRQSTQLSETTENRKLVISWNT